MVASSNPAPRPNSSTNRAATTVVIVGGGRLAIALVGWAREAGLAAIVIDRDAKAPVQPHVGRTHPIAFEDHDALRTLARELAAQGETVRAIAAPSACDGPANRASAAAIEAAAVIDAEARGTEAALEAVRRALDPGASAAALAAARVPTVESGAPHDVVFDVQGFFRDGAFVPAGVVARALAANGRRDAGIMPPDLPREAESSAYRLVERAALALGIADGAASAEVVFDADDEPRVVRVTPSFGELASTILVTPLVLGKSPHQALFAALTGAGGPFDTMPSARRGTAGWIALRADRAGRFEGVQGIERVRTLPGVGGVIVAVERGAELPGPDDERALVGWVWASGYDSEEVERRLERARALLTIDVVERVAA